MDETKIITQYYDTDKNDNNFYSNINSKIIILLIAYIILISYKTYLNIVITSIKVIYDKITKLLSLFNNNNTNTTINILTEEICEIQVSYNKLYNLYENLNKQYKTLQISHNRLEKYQEKNKELYITRKEVVNLLKDNITNTEDKIKNIRSEFGDEQNKRQDNYLTDTTLVYDLLKIFITNLNFNITSIPLPTIPHVRREQNGLVGHSTDKIVRHPSNVGDCRNVPIRAYMNHISEIYKKLTEEVAEGDCRRFEQKKINETIIKDINNELVNRFGINIDDFDELYKKFNDKYNEYHR